MKFEYIDERTFKNDRKFKFNEQYYEITSRVVSYEIIRNHLFLTKKPMIEDNGTKRFREKECFTSNSFKELIECPHPFSKRIFSFWFKLCEEDDF